MIRLAYNLQGERVPYNSRDYILIVKLMRDSMECDHQGLPIVGNEVYMPEGLAKKVREDLREQGGDGLVLVSIMTLPDSEATARTYAEMLRNLNEGMPPADERFLSTVIG